MSQTHPRPSHSRRETRNASGATLATLALLVIGVAIAAPWLARRVFAWPHAPVVAVFVALLPALYLWFRVGQRAKRGTALATAAAYAALAAGVLWLWRGL